MLEDSNMPASKDDYGWRFDKPPVTKDMTGKDSIVWYEVLYDDSSVGQSCWWYNHWYGNSNWTGIIAWREINDQRKDKSG